MAQQWQYTVVGVADFGGFEAELVGCEGGPIFVQAKAWKGVQPRIVLEPGHSGYQDWIRFMTPATRRVTFEGNDEFAQNLSDQWLTHGRRVS